MKQVGFLFPGQGAQAVGMGHDFYEASREARSIFDRADQILGFPSSKLCFEGPETELRRTANTQITIFVVSIAALATIRSLFPQIRPALSCGLSLGEFTALVALDALSFEDGLQLVKRRGELMEEADRKNPGVMASLIGLSLKECETICEEVGVEIANINSYEQIVISGSAQAINKACELAKEKNAKHVILLKVGGAFHSAFMGPARTGLEEALRKIRIKKPKGMFIANVNGEVASEPERIQQLLAEQLTRPVQWVKTMERVRDLGFKELLEIGPGRVLKGLARKIAPDLVVTNIEKTADLDALKPIAVDS